MVDRLIDTATPADPAVDWPKRKPRTPQDVKFLQAPQSGRLEPGPAVRTFRELIYGFHKLPFVGPCVTVFGPTRFREDHPYYTMAREVGRLLAGRGFMVITGGGPGVMEAANREAMEAGGRSIG